MSTDELEKLSYTYSDSSKNQTYNSEKFDNEKVVAFIGQGVEFKGTISYKGSIRIDGRVNGEIHTEGNLLVGEQAIVTATITAGSVVSKGQITGDIKANEKVLLAAAANMNGDLNTPRLTIEDGVIFNGTIEMKRPTMA